MEPLIKRSHLSTKVGTEVDSLTVTLQVNPGAVAAGVPLAAFALQGGFDGARLRVERFFASGWGVPPAGSLGMFEGRVADVDASATQVQMQVKSGLEVLNIKLPRNLYTASCGHSLYDGGCRVQRSQFTVQGQAGAGSDRRFVAAATAEAAGYFEQGAITFTSGPNAGQVRTVRSHGSEGVGVVFPFPYVPQEGDAFEIVPGCDRRRSTCESKFGNLQNFRGFPFIPVPETTF
jgi:uncharacterized phage protein (TIGR02218 family)